MARKIDPEKLREMQRSKEQVGTPPPREAPESQYPSVTEGGAEPVSPAAEPETVYVPVPTPQAPGDDTVKKGFGWGLGLAIGCSVGCLLLLALIFLGPILIATWTATGTPPGH